MFSDEALIFKIGQNDMEALRQFYDETNREIFGFALSITKNLHDAEDVLQETYLRVRANAIDYKPQGKPMAWVFTIARNLCLMKMRKSKREMSIDDEVGENLLSSLSEVHNIDDRLLLQGALTILSDEERQIIMLHAVSGFKHREIGQMMNLPLSTVLSKNSRALKKLKDYLNTQGGNEK